MHAFYCKLNGHRFLADEVHADYVLDEPLQASDHVTIHVGRRNAPLTITLPCSPPHDANVSVFDEDPPSARHGYVVTVRSPAPILATRESERSYGRSPVAACAGVVLNYTSNGPRDGRGACVSFLAQDASWDWYAGNDADAVALAWSIRLRPRRPQLAAALGVVTTRGAAAWNTALAKRCALAFDLEGVQPYRDARDYWPRSNGRQGEPAPYAVTSSAEAWEAFAAHDLVPAAWIGSTARKLGVSVHEPPVDGDAESLACPTDPRLAAIELAVALAADPEGVERAEVCARAAAQCERVADVVTWRLVNARWGERYRDGARCEPPLDFGLASRLHARRVPEAIGSLGYAVHAVDRGGVTLVCPGLL